MALGAMSNVPHREIKGTRIDFLCSIMYNSLQLSLYQSIYTRRYYNMRR